MFEVFFELRRRMLILYSISSLDAKDQSFLADLNYIAQCVADRSQPALTECIVQLGIVELSQHVLAETFWRPDLFHEAATLELVNLVLGVMSCATDGNRLACEHVLYVDFQKDLFEMLRADKLDPSKVQFDEQRCIIADCIMAVLYNVIQVCLSQFITIPILTVNVDVTNECRLYFNFLLPCQLIDYIRIRDKFDS